MMTAEQLNSRTIISQGLDTVAKICGSEVLSIPLMFGHSESGDIKAPSYTDVNGIYVSQEVLTLDPQNFPIYFLHEVGHHIFHNSVYTDKFPHRIVNFAEDFKINQWMEEEFGYDVTKVRVPGLRDKKYDKLSVSQVCAKLKPFSKHKKCGCFGIAHPAIMAIAERMRAKYNINLEANQDHFIVDLMDKQKFYAASRIATKYFKHFEEISSVNMQKALLGVWSQLYLSKAISYPVGKHLEPGQAISYVYNAAPFRESTINNTTLSMLSAVLFLRKADRDRRRIKFLIYKNTEILAKIDKAIRKLEGKTPNEKINERLRSLHAREIAAQKRLNQLKATPPFNVLLHEKPIKVIPKKSLGSSPASLANIWENNATKLYRQNVKIPSIQTNETSQRIKLISRMALKEYEIVRKITEELGESFGVDFTDDFEETSTEENQEQETSTEENQEQETTEEDSENQATESTNEATDEGETKAQPTGIIKKSGGKGISDVKSAPRENKLELMLEISKNTKDLRFILSKMQEFETQFSNNRTRNVSESNDLPSAYGYGNDLENIVPSELALLFSKETELEFLTRLANHSLLQHQPPSNKRLPICICIDSSGSMGKVRFNTAMAFAMALMKKLHKEGRGIALMTFTSHVDQFMVLRPNEAFKPLHLINFLRKANVGGTSFDAPVLKAFDIKAEERWRNMQTILVTDGDAYFLNVGEIKNRKMKGDVITGVLCNSEKFQKGDQDILDEVILASSSNMEVQLVKLANKVL